MFKAINLSMLNSLMKIKSNKWNKDLKNKMKKNTTRNDYKFVINFFTKYA